jgi:TonB-linked SusC/RagA family outer membrane protein
MYCDHDWYRELIKKYTPQTNVSVDLSGGTKQLSYFINAGFVHQGGNLNTIKNSSYNPAAEMNRYTFRTNLDYKFTKSLSAYLNLGTYIQIQNMPLSGGLYSNSEGTMMKDLMQQAIMIVPITPGPLTIDGFGAPAGQLINTVYQPSRSAYEIMNGRGSEQNTLSNLNSTVGTKLDLSQAVTPGLSIKGEVSFDTYGGTTYQKSITCELYTCNLDYNSDSFTFGTSRVPGSNLSISSEGTSTHYRVNLQGSINYDRTFGGKHKVGALILGQRDFWDISGGTSTALIPYNIIGIAGRVTYDYDSRYFAEFDMGYNGSEQFAPKNRFGFFPAYSAGWVLSNEDFLKGNNTLTNLKLRASYGIVGNDQIGSTRFLYLDNNSVTTGGYTAGLDNGKVVSIGLVGNPDVHWEIAHKLNLGVDVGLFKNLKGSFDYFKEHRTDILITRGTVPNFQGVASANVPKANMGIVDNHGFEAELSYYLPVNKNLSFNFKGNYSFARNVVKYADEVKNDSSYCMQYGTTGYRVGQCAGYKIDWATNGGYWTSAEEYAASGLQYEIGTPGAGDFRYKDLNGDGKINSKDEVPIGYSGDVPEIIYGISLGANYKSFDCSVMFQGVTNYSGWYSGPNIYETAGNGTYFDYQLNAWTQERYEKGEKITYPALHTIASTNQVANDFFIMDRSFLRLKNAEIGYTLAKNELKAIGVTKLRVFVGGQNLYLWDALRTKHLDPELSNGTLYPLTKMWNFGLNVTF